MASEGSYVTKRVSSMRRKSFLRGSAIRPFTILVDPSPSWKRLSLPKRWFLAPTQLFLSEGSCGRFLQCSMDVRRCLPGFPGFHQGFSQLFFGSSAGVPGGV